MIDTDAGVAAALPFSGHRADRWIDVACRAKIAALASLMRVSLMLLYNGLGTGLPWPASENGTFSLLGHLSVLVNPLHMRRLDCFHHFHVADQVLIPASGSF